MSKFIHVRKQLKLTQAELAREIGVSQANVSHYEHGQNIPPGIARKLIALAQSRGISISFDDIYGVAAA